MPDLAEMPPDGFTFQIPPCQRPYCWKLSDIEHVLADVADKRSSESTTPWYFGPICFRRDKDVLQIYDGQQRLTSMLLVVSVLAERLQADGANLGLSEEQAERLRRAAAGAAGAGSSSAANTALAMPAAIQQARNTATRRFLICCSSSHSLPWGLSPTGIALEYTAPAPQNASRCMDVQKVIFSSKKKKHPPTLAGAQVNYAVFTPGRTCWARRAGRSCGQRCCMRSGRR